VERVPEPELMDDPLQAAAYAQADFAESHQAIVDRFLACFPHHPVHRVLDLGCGSGDVTFRFARAYPNAEVLGVDGAEAMLVHARAAASAGDLAAHARFLRARLPTPSLPTGFDTVISNSLLHHLADPATLWEAAARCAAPGAALFIADLARPASPEEARHLVERYATGEPDVLKRDFYHSLCAAYRPAEVELQLERAGLGHLRVEQISDRHLVVFGFSPRGTLSA
jgi:ubiquinone/menaquinone biosynthesis C-methylase UbiE